MTFARLPHTHWEKTALLDVGPTTTSTTVASNNAGTDAGTEAESDGRRHQARVLSPVLSSFTLQRMTAEG